MDNRPKIRVKFIKRNGQRGSVLQPAPADWGSMSRGARQAWATNVAHHVHNGATGATWETA